MNGVQGQAADQPGVFLREAGRLGVRTLHLFRLGAARFARSNLTRLSRPWWILSQITGRSPVSPTRGPRGSFNRISQPRTTKESPPYPHWAGALGLVLARIRIRSCVQGAVRYSLWLGREGQGIGAASIKPTSVHALQFTYYIAPILWGLWGRKSSVRKQPAGTGTCVVPWFQPVSTTIIARKLTRSPCDDLPGWTLTLATQN